VGEDGRGALGTEGQADVGGGDDLAGQAGEGLTDLLAEHRATGLAQDADERPGHGLRLLGDGLTHRADDVLGDRQDQRLPGGRGRFDPLGATPGRCGRGTGGDVGDLVEPRLGQADGVVDRTGLAGVGRRVGAGCREGLPRDVLGHREVDRTVVWPEHLLHLAEQRTEVGRLTAGAAECSEQTLHRRSGERVLWRRIRLVVAVRIVLVGHVARLPSDPQHSPAYDGPR
jgi:hypothetical protein